MVLLALAATTLNAIITRGMRTVPSQWRREVPVAVVVAAVTLLPWLWLGALGGPLLTLSAAVAAVAVGALAARILARASGDAVVAPGLRLDACGWRGADWWPQSCYWSWEPGRHQRAANC
ncbi:hypothetical protein [Streptosporangium sp. NPDC002607]